MSDLLGVHREINCQRSVEGVSFSQGVQVFDFSVGGRTGFIPRKSYFRIECELKDKAAAVTVDKPIPKKKFIALSDNFAGNLYNNCYVRMAGSDVSSITSFLPQASILKQRLDKSGAVQERTLSSLNFLDPYFESRQNKTMFGGSGFQPKRDIRPIGVDTATIEIKIGPLAVVGTQTELSNPTTAGGYSSTALEVGDILVVANIEYVVTVAPTADDGTTMVIERVDGEAVAAVAATTDAYILKRASSNKFFVTYIPPCGFFDEETPLGSGQYRIELNPNADYKTSVIQSFLKYDPLANDTYDFKVTNIRFYAYTIKSDIPASFTKVLNLTEMAIYQKTSQGSQSNLEFTIPSSTMAISVFIQPSTVGTDTRTPPNLFKLIDGSDENMTSLQITYGNITKPSVQWNSENQGFVDTLQQRYHDSLMESSQLWNTGGCESFEEFKLRGMHYTYSFLRDKDDRSTQASVRLNFGGPKGQAFTGGNNVNVLICAHYQRTVNVVTSDGYVTEVSSADV